MDFNPIGPFPGIYALELDGKFYIGSSKNINKRVTEHKRLLRLGTHYNKTLQHAYNTCSTFKWHCIKECAVEELLVEEQALIDKELPVLNESLSATYPKLTQEQIDRKQSGERNHMAKITLEQAVSIIRHRNNKLTLKEISNITGISYSTVVYICSAKGWAAALKKEIPEEYSLFETNISTTGKENKAKISPGNRLFNDESLLDVLKLLLAGSTLQSIADKYSTSKAVISSIKNFKVYKKDIERLLSAEDLKTFKGNR